MFDVSILNSLDSDFKNIIIKYNYKLNNLKFII